MTDDPINPHYDPTIDRIRAIWDEWQPLLDLPGLTVDHRFLETRDDSDPLTGADTEVKWAYRWAVIRWYLPSLSGLPDAELEAIAVHEFAHLLLGTIVDRLKTGSDEHNEHATESVARALLAARRSSLETL